MLGTIFNLIKRNDREKRRLSLDTLLQSIDKHLDNLDDLILPSPHSKPRTPFDTKSSDTTPPMMTLPLKEKLRVVDKMVPLMLNMQRAARMYNSKFTPKQEEATPEFIEELQRMAYDMGAKDIAFVRVPNNAIFKDKGIPHEYAVVFTVEMDKEPIDTSPSFDSQLEVMKGYKDMAIIANRLSGFMRKNGFAAYPGTALGGITDYTHLGELAGIGAIGYHDLLITPDEGARLRINTIYTNITNLPIREENEHLWVRDFCAMCKKCVRGCPAKAIFDQPKPRGDGGMQCIDHDDCREYFTANFGCGICLAICPFSQVGYDKVKERFKGNPNAPQFHIPVEAIQ